MVHHPRPLQKTDGPSTNQLLAQLAFPCTLLKARQHSKTTLKRVPCTAARHHADPGNKEKCHAAPLRQGKRGSKEVDDSK
eukprot:5487115-Pleurochrysis_carterae.AAC.1